MACHSLAVWLLRSPTTKPRRNCQTVAWSSRAEFAEPPGAVANRQLLQLWSQWSLEIPDSRINRIKWVWVKIEYPNNGMMNTKNSILNFINSNMSG